MSKTTTLYVYHAFLYISLPSLHNYRILIWLKNGNVEQGDKFYYLSELRRTPLLFSSNLTSLLSSNWMTWYNV